MSWSSPHAEALYKWRKLIADMVGIPEGLVLTNKLLFRLAAMCPPHTEKDLIDIGVHAWVVKRQSFTILRILNDNVFSSFDHWPNMKCLNCFKLGHFAWACKEEPNNSRTKEFAKTHPDYRKRHNARRWKNWQRNQYVKTKNGGHLVHAIVRVKKAYKASSSLEINLKVGEIIRVLRSKTNDKEANNMAFDKYLKGLTWDGKVGYFPKYYTKKIFDRSTCQMYGL